MRGFSGTQINTLYNGIKIGPSEMTGRVMDTANLEQIEILKGPASLMSGEGATGGAINYVNKKPHIGKIVNEAFTSFDSFYGFRAGFGSGGSTAVKGLDYRFDGPSQHQLHDDTCPNLTNISALDIESPTAKMGRRAEVGQEQVLLPWFLAFSAALLLLAGRLDPDPILSGGPRAPISAERQADASPTYNVLDNTGAKERGCGGLSGTSQNVAQEPSLSYKASAAGTTTRSMRSTTPGPRTSIRSIANGRHPARRRLMARPTDFIPASLMRTAAAALGRAGNRNVVQDDFFNSDFVICQSGSWLHGPQQTSTSLPLTIFLTSRIGRRSPDASLLGGLRVRRST